MPSSLLPPFLPTHFQLPARVRKVRYGAKSDKNHAHNLPIKKEIKQNKPKGKFSLLFPIPHMWHLHGLFLQKFCDLIVAFDLRKPAVSYPDYQYPCITLYSKIIISSGPISLIEPPALLLGRPTDDIALKIELFSFLSWASCLAQTLPSVTEFPGAALHLVTQESLASHFSWEFDFYFLENWLRAVWTLHILGTSQWRLLLKKRKSEL